MKQRHRSVAFAIMILLAVGAASAAPSVAPGGCVTLVGPGSVPEALSSGATVGTSPDHACADFFTSTTGRTDPHSVQAWADTTPLGPFCDRWCDAIGWVANRFEVAGTDDVLARVSVEGWYRGILRALESSDGIMPTNAIDARVALVDAATGAVVEERQVFARRPQLGGISYDGRYAAELSATLRAGREYDVRLTVYSELATKCFGGVWFDFGRNRGYGVGYDRIEVCLTAPEDWSDIRAGLADANAKLDALQDSVDSLDAELDGVSDSLAVLDAKADETLALLRAQARKDIEWKLYQKDCLPSLWHPTAQGGQAEEARTVVTDLIAASRDTGEPGANIRLAEQKLTSADEAFADGEFQRSCRLLSDAVRALTVP